MFSGRKRAARRKKHTSDKKKLREIEISESENI
jgi:hypothetical protein